LLQLLFEVSLFFKQSFDPFGQSGFGRFQQIRHISEEHGVFLNRCYR